MRYRRQPVDRRRAVGLRITAPLREARVVEPKGARRWGPGWLAWLATAEGLGTEARFVIGEPLAELRHLDGRIAMVEARLAKVTAEDPVIARPVAMKGVGPVTAWALRAEIGRFDRSRTGKQLARYCGLTPRDASSGQRQADAGLIKAGSELLRATLIEAAHRPIRLDERWGAPGAKLRGAGKPGSVVAAAVADRWVRWLSHQVGGGRITSKAAG